MNDATILIPLVIIAITQMVKMASPKVGGWVTILIAFAVAIVVSLLSFILPTEVLGIAHISIGGAVISALGAVGVTVLASKAGGGTIRDRSIVVNR
jgi:hypothetical protein